MKREMMKTLIKEAALGAVVGGVIGGLRIGMAGMPLTWPFQSAAGLGAIGHSVNTKYTIPGALIGAAVGTAAIPLFPVVLVNTVLTTPVVVAACTAGHMYKCHLDRQKNKPMDAKWEETK